MTNVLKYLKSCFTDGSQSHISMISCFPTVNFFCKINLKITSSNLLYQQNFENQ